MRRKKPNKRKQKQLERRAEEQAKKPKRVAMIGHVSAGQSGMALAVLAAMSSIRPEPDL